MSAQLHGMLISAYNDMRGSYVTRRLVEEAQRAGISLKVVGVADTVVEPDGRLGNDGVSLQQADFALVRYKEGRVKDRLAGLCRRSYNALASFNRFVDKYEQLLALEGSSLVCPASLLAASDTPYSTIATRLGTPYVAKGLRSSMGKEVFLVSNVGDQQALLHHLGPQREVLYQTYVASSHGRDARLFVIRGEVMCAMQRTARHGFKANVARGAEVVALPVTEEMRVSARSAYERTALDFFGLDLLFGPSGLMFCEANVMPGFEGMERATGVNVAAHIIDLIRGDLA